MGLSSTLRSKKEAKSEDVAVGVDERVQGESIE